MASQRFDAGRWWPAGSDFEVFVGAILTQNTAWTNVERALENLRNLDLLDPQRLLAAALADLANLVRPSGYANTKAGYLREVACWFLDNHKAAEVADFKAYESVRVALSPAV